MEQGRYGLTPRTQRRSQKLLLDTSKEHFFCDTAKFFVRKLMVRGDF